MTSNKNNSVIANPWKTLRQFTDARIGLGRSGVSVPTQELLEFQLAHARARDAVHLPLNFDALTNELAKTSEQFSILNSASPIKVHSQAIDRMTYLQRPDLGRKLDEESRLALQGKEETLKPYDLALVVADGLSATAIEKNANEFIQELAVLLSSTNEPWQLAPIVLVEQGRVAIADEIGALLNARATLIMIGERPGLSSPDSLGLYLTWAPEPGLKDDRRNCISNVRKAGLSHRDAAQKTLYLLTEAKRLNVSGVAIKDRSNNTDSIIEKSEGSFLLFSKQ
ncbi:ethanolamine ammonia-lyase subunit EutC [Sessilibacter sp. MAH4]